MKIVNKQYTRAQRREIENHGTKLRGLLKELLATERDNLPKWQRALRFKELNHRWKEYAKSNNRGEGQITLSEEAFEKQGKLVIARVAKAKADKAWYNRIQPLGWIAIAAIILITLLIYVVQYA